MEAWAGEAKGMRTELQYSRSLQLSCFCIYSQWMETYTVCQPSRTLSDIFLILQGWVYALGKWLEEKKMGPGPTCVHARASCASQALTGRPLSFRLQVIQLAHNNVRGSTGSP